MTPDANDADDQPATVAAGDDATAIVPPPTPAVAPELAWSVGDDPEEPSRRQASAMPWVQVAVISVFGLALVTAIGVAVFAAVFAAEQSRPRNGAAPSAPGPAWAIPPISSPGSSTPPAGPKPAEVPPAPPATTTVTVAEPAPAPPAPAPPPTEGNFAICPSGHAGVATTVTSCAFADNVRRSYLIQGGPEVLAYSPVTGETYTMDCVGGFTAHLSDGEVLQAVRCTGGNDAVVVVW